MAKKETRLVMDLEVGDRFFLETQTDLPPRTYRVTHVLPLIHRLYSGDGTNVLDWGVYGNEAECSHPVIGAVQEGSDGNQQWFSGNGDLKVFLVP